MSICIWLPLPPMFFGDGQNTSRTCQALPTVCQFEVDISLVSYRGLGIERTEPTYTSSLMKTTGGRVVCRHERVGTVNLTNISRSRRRNQRCTRRHDQRCGDTRGSHPSRPTADERGCLPGATAGEEGIERRYHNRAHCLFREAKRVG